MNKRLDALVRFIALTAIALAVLHFAASFPLTPGLLLTLTFAGVTMLAIRNPWFPEQPKTPPLVNDQNETPS